MILILIVSSPAPAKKSNIGIEFLMKKEQYSKLLKRLSEFEEKKPELYRERCYDFLKARIFELKDQKDKALEIYRDFVERTTPIKDYGYFRAAEILKEQKEDYGEPLRTLVKNHPRSLLRGRAYLRLGKYYTDRGKYNGALKIFTRIVEKYPEFGREAGFLRIKIYTEINNKALVWRYTRNFLEDNLKDDFAYKTIKLLKNSSHLEPDSGLYRFYKARVFFENRKFRSAVRVFSELKDKEFEKSRYSRILYLEGKSYIRIGNYKKAREVLELLKNKGATNNWKAKAFYHLGRIMIGRGKIRKAVEILRSAFEKYPESEAGADCLSRLIRIVNKKKYTEEAIELSKKYLKNYPGSKSYFRIGVELGYHFLEEGNTKKALEFFSKAAGDPERWKPGRTNFWRWREEAFFRKGLLLKKMEKPQKALENFYTIARKNPRGLYAEFVRNSLDFSSENIDFAYFLERGRELVEKNSARSSIPFFHKALLSKDTRPEALRELKAAVKSSDEYGKYFKLKPESIDSIFGGSGDLHRRKAEVFFNLKLFDSGIDELKVSIDNAGLQDYVNLSFYYSKGKSYYDSIKYAGKASYEFPEYFPFSLYPRELKKLLYPRYYKNPVLEYSGKEGVDANLIFAVIREESHFDPGIKSWAAARGLMQFIPATARRIGKELGLNLKIDQLYIPEISIRLGTRYLHNLMKEFKNPYYAAAAYNGGETRVRRWIKNNEGSQSWNFIKTIPIEQTRNYVKKVMASYKMYERIYSEEQGKRSKD